MPGADSTLRATLPFLPVAAAEFCIQLDFFSLNLALPTIATELATPVTDLQWALSGYMIALGSLLIPAGRLGDVVGRRRVLLIGVAVFGLTSLVCGLTSAPALLIAARVAQGAGAAMIMPSAMALITNATDEKIRPRVIGAVLGIAGVGTALGPVAGGVLASTLGWRWVFLLNVPIAAFALWRGLRLTESRGDTGPGALARMDWWGILTVVGGLVGVSVAIDDVSAEGWTSTATLVPLVGGLVLLAAFAVIETRVAEPLVRPSLLRNNVYVVLLVSATLANIGTCVFVFGATLDLQEVRGLSAAAAGLLFFAASIGLAVCGPLAGRLSVRFLPGVVMGFAVLLAAPALTALAFVEPLPLYVLVLAFCGVTTGMGYSLGQIAVQNVLPAKRSAEGTSVMLTLLISIGGIGVVVASAVVEAFGDPGPTAAGLSVVLVAVAVVLLVAGPVTIAVARAAASARSDDPVERA